MLFSSAIYHVTVCIAITNAFSIRENFHKLKSTLLSNDVDGIKEISSIGDLRGYVQGDKNILLLQLGSDSVVMADNVFENIRIPSDCIKYSFKFTFPKKMKFFARIGAGHTDWKEYGGDVNDYEKVSKWFNGLVNKESNGFLKGIVSTFT